MCILKSTVGKLVDNLHKRLQGRSVQTGVISQEIQLLQLEVVTVVALSLSLQDLENCGSKHQVCEVCQSQKCYPAHFDPDHLEPRHQPPPVREKIQTNAEEAQTQRID